MPLIVGTFLLQQNTIKLTNEAVITQLSYEAMLQLGPLLAPKVLKIMNTVCVPNTLS